MKAGWKRCECCDAFMVDMLYSCGAEQSTEGLVEGIMTAAYLPLQAWTATCTSAWHVRAHKFDWVLLQSHSLLTQKCLRFSSVCRITGVERRHAMLAASHLPSTSFRCVSPTTRSTKLLTL